MLKKQVKNHSGYQSCQIHSVHMYADATSNLDDQLPLPRKIKSFVKRRLGLKFLKTRKLFIDRLLTWWNKLNAKQVYSSDIQQAPVTYRLAAGDIVRVRTEKEIRETLNRWNELKGCAFIDEMSEYCGTTQRVLKRVERFVDERDYTPKKVRGILLLEGVICQGTAYYGKCDRTCLYFWREEWLEKVE